MRSLLRVCAVLALSHVWAAAQSDCVQAVPTARLVRTQSRGYVQLPKKQEVELPASWKFAHPNADALMGVNVAGLRQSPTVQAVLGQLATAVKLKPEEVTAKLQQFGEVDEVWVSAAQQDVLLLVQGRTKFPAGFVRQSDGMTTYRISNNAVVMGQPDSVLAAVKRIAFEKGTESTLARQMKELSEHHDIWMAGAPGTTKLQAVGPLTEGLRGFSGGISLQDGVKLAMRLQYAEEQQARQVLALLRAKAAPASSQVTTATEVEGSSVQVTAAVAQAQLLEILKQRLNDAWAQQWSTIAAQKLGAAQPGRNKSWEKHVTDFKAPTQKVTFD